MAKRRPAGDGLVRKRADGRWEGRIVVGHKEDGSPIFRSVFAHTQKDVMRKLHSQIETYRDVELTEESNMTLGEWLDKWLDSYMALTIRESTMDSYKIMTQHYIKPYLGDEKIGSVTTADIQQLYNWLRENGRVKEHYEKGNALSDSMIRSIHMMIHQAMDAAVRERLIVKNPTEGTVIPKNNYAPKQILTEEQLERFLEVAKADPVWSDFFYTELTTGMRLGEICGLKWQDFEEKTGRLHIRRSVHRRKGGGVRVGETKTETGTRTILLPPSTIEILKARKKKSYSDWIFHNPVVPEVPMDPSNAYHRLKTLLRHAELPSIRFHDLRHPYVKHTTKIFSLRLKFFQAQQVPDALRKTRGAFLHLREGGSHSPFLRSCNKKLSSWSIPQSKMSLILYAISMRLSGYTSTLSIRRSVSSAVRPSELKTALAASCRLSCRACSSCFCFACANTTA